MSMLKKVTRKIAAEFDTASLEMMLPDYRAQFERAARAAIEAMCEPTEEMLAAVKDLAPEWDHATAPPTLRHKLGANASGYWTRMIDAALKEPSSSSDVTP